MVKWLAFPIRLLLAQEPFFHRRSFRLVAVLAAAIKLAVARHLFLSQNKFLHILLGVDDLNLAAGFDLVV
jgi:hypothetical protein